MTGTVVVAEWTEHPYVSYDKRTYEIRHRVVIEHYHGVGADVRHEVQSPDDDSVPNDWTECDAYELRDHGIRNVPGGLEVHRS